MTEDAQDDDPHLNGHLVDVQDNPESVQQEYCCIAKLVQGYVKCIFPNEVNSIDYTPDLPPNQLTSQAGVADFSPQPPVSPMMIQNTTEPTTSRATTPPINKEALSTCMGKLKLACSVNLYVRRLLDKYVGSGRVDKIRDVIDAEADLICNPDENLAMEAFLNNHTDAILVAQGVTNNLTNSDKDLLNTMDNLNDTIGERFFYLRRFSAVNETDRAVLELAFNDIMKTFTSSSAPNATVQAVTALSPADLTKIRNVDDVNRFNLVTERLNACNITDTNVASDVTRLFLIPSVD
ncbi:unnamed protein product [Haemonchus placei]|uniref:ORF112 n=1 Tax=Haemonchus placei TaxID=6290 RepID=A0A0N4WTV7_HAEPC|nr:unnamed protein product [Haemonchus placei]